MSKEIITSGLLGTVFATTGVALPVAVALIAYISIALKTAALTPPAATKRETSVQCGKKGTRRGA
jgi:hypothetical protein